MEPKFKRVVVTGAGGVGYWLTWALCRQLNGIIPVEVYDPDTFSGGNGFKRLPRAADKDLHKVELLRMQVAFVMGDAAPEVHPKYLLPEDFQDGDWTETLVVDCTDMGQDERVKFWEALSNAGAKGLRVSYDGLGVQTVSPGPPLMAGGATGGGYQILPNIAQSLGAAGLGAQAVLYMLYTGKPLEFNVHVPTPETESVEIQ